MKEGQPRRQNRPLARWVFRFLVWSLGWKIEMGDAFKAPQYVIVGAHHTTNWDGFFAAAMLACLDIKGHFMIKEEWVKTPLIGRLVVWLGGVAIDRSHHLNVVEQMVEKYRQDPHFIISITPEGTRHKTRYWKTGFYNIATQAQVPLLMAFADYKRKAAGFGPLIYPSGDLEADMEKHIRPFFRQVTAKFPEYASEMLIRPKEEEQPADQPRTPAPSG